MRYDYDGPQVLSEAKACRRDIEGDIKRINERIEVFSEMKIATEKFIKRVGLHWINDRVHRDGIMVAFAGLTLELPDLERERDALIAEQERENARG